MQENTTTNPNLLPQTVQTKEREKFYHRSLTELRENEMAIKQYWSKLVLVIIPNFYSNGFEGEVRFRGEFSCCDDAGWISFNDVLYEKHPQVQFLEGMDYPEYYAPAIGDIILIEQQNTDDEKHEHIKSNPSYRLGKSIKNIILDVIRLKLVRKALMKLPTSYGDLAPLNPINRRDYFQKSTPSSIKRGIAHSILNMKKIPQHLNTNSAFQMAFQTAMLEEEKIRTNLCNYNLDDALSLLCDYHNLWIQYIQKHNDEKENSENVYNKNYMDWDTLELMNNLPVHPPVLQTVFNSEFEQTSVYCNKYKYIFDGYRAPITRRKVETVSVQSIWPYHFVGPFTKLKKNNPYWLCMKCHKECATPAIDMKENIYFYKANRTDMTMEVCCLCIDAFLGLQKSAKYFKKQMKAAKRYDKRLKKKLAEYAEQEIPWTPPCILNGMPYYGINAPPKYPMPYSMPYSIPTFNYGLPQYGAMGPTYTLPYPMLPTYIPGMNPPLQPNPQSSVRINKYVMNQKRKYNYKLRINK